MTVALYNKDASLAVEPSIAPNTNFNIFLFLSDVDVASNMARVIERVPAIFEEAGLTKGLQPLNSVLIHSTAQVHIPRATCYDIKYLCVNVTSAASATYTTPDEQSIAKCTNISEYRNCRGQSMTLLLFH